MTVSEARAVNRLLTWIVGREPYPLHVPLPTDDDALRAAGYLADRASKALMAGWDGERLSPAWRTRPAPQPTSPTSATPRRTDMAGRIVPEPPQPNHDPERLAEERELARSAHLAGLAVQRAADLGRLLGGQQPDHSTLDQLDHLADPITRMDQVREIEAWLHQHTSAPHIAVITYQLLLPGPIR